MKRRNYYQVHKNKAPKRLIYKKKPNNISLKLLALAMNSFCQHAIIVSQQFNSIAEKSLAILDNVINHCNAITNLLKEEKANIKYHAKS